MESSVNILRPIVKGMLANGLQSKVRKLRRAAMDYEKPANLSRGSRNYFNTNIVVFGLI